MTELCAREWNSTTHLLSSRSFFARASPGFDSVVTLLIRLHIPDDRESRRGPLSVRCKNSKRRLAAKPSASITPSKYLSRFIEVAAAVCKYRHDRWKFEWGKPQFTRLDVAIGSNVILTVGWPLSR
jgi:hypothetical protein